MEVLNERGLKRLYTELGYTDREIADFIGVAKCTISKLRKKYGIPTREYTGSVGEKRAVQELVQRGFHVIDMNKQDKYSEFDLLVNGHRVEVKSAHLAEDKRFRFSLTENISRQAKGNRVQLPNGRTRKKYHETCDFFLFVGIDGEETHYFVVPVSHVPDYIQTVSVLHMPNKKSKYEAYRDAFYWLEKSRCANSGH